MGAGSDRNNPCWCGSGKKFKKCHLGREADAPPSVGEILGEAKKIHDRKDCVHPGKVTGTCRGPIIKAHSVQRALLEKIARKDHVIHWNHHLASIIKNKGSIVADKIGIKDASTFTGFCAFHDDSTFATIEKSAIVPSNDHALLIAYRALCREVFAKSNQLAMSEYQKTLDRGMQFKDQILLQYFSSDYQDGVELGLRDLLHHKRLYDAAIVADDATNVRSYWFELDRQPEYACTGGIFPEVDFQGKMLQDLSDTSTTLDMVFFSVLPGDTRGLAVFSWLDPSAASAALVDSLLQIPAAEIPHAITRFSFEFYENVFIEPNWWDNLSDADKRILISRAESSFPHTPRLLTCLADDGQRIARCAVAQQHDFR
jgi:SEC-C motif